MSDFDLERLAALPDPCAEAASAPLALGESPPSLPAPTRSRVRAFRAVAVVAALVYDAVWPAFVQRRGDLGSLSLLRLALGLAIPLTAAAISINAARRNGDRGLGATTNRLLMLVLASPVLFAGATLLTAPPEVYDDSFWRHATGCAIVSAELAIGPLALGLLAFRRAFAAASAWRAAALGVACGALAAATMSLVCPLGNAAHVVLGHGGVMLLTGIVGAWLGPRICRA